MTPYHPAPYRTPILAAAVVVAYAMYIVGNSNGASQPTYVDETNYDVYAFQLAQALSGEGVPTFMTVYPSGYSLLLSLLYGGWFTIGRLTGEFGSLSDFLVRFAVDRAPFIIIGRHLSAAFAAVALPGTYFAANRLYGRRVAVVATAALGLSYPVVFFAHIAANITMLICLSAWTLYWLTRVLQEGTVKSYLVCGAFIGAGIGTKYYPALWFVTLALAHLYSMKEAGLVQRATALKWRSGRLLGAVALAVPVALLLFPVPLIAHDQWRAGLSNNIGYYVGGSALENTASALFGRATFLDATTAEPISFFSNSFRVLTPVGLAWVLVSVVAGLVLRTRITLLLMLPIGLFFTYQVFAGGLSLGIRQFYFALPAVYIVSAAALADVCQRLPVRQPRQTLLFSVVAMLILAQPVSWTVRYLALATRPSTIDIARADLVRLIPPGSTLLVDSSAAPFGETVNWRTEGIRQGDAADAAAAARDARRRAAPPFEVQMFTWDDAAADLSRASRTGTLFVAITDHFSTGRWHPDTIRVWGNLNLHVAESRRAYLERVLEQAELVKEYRPRDLRALGPMITLFRVHP